MAHLLELAHLYMYWILNKLSYKAQTGKIHVDIFIWLYIHVPHNKKI